MTPNYRQYIPHLLIGLVILAGSFFIPTFVFDTVYTPTTSHTLFLPVMRKEPAMPLFAAQGDGTVQSPLLLDAFGTEVYAKLVAGEMPWDLGLQLTPDQWDAWYQLDRIMLQPSILLDAFGPVEYAKLQAGHYPSDIQLSLTQELWDAWYQLDRMDDEDLPTCPLYDSSPESFRQKGIITERSAWDARPICLVVPEYVIDHTQAISDIVALGGSPRDIGITDDPPKDED